MQVGGEDPSERGRHPHDGPFLGETSIDLPRMGDLAQPTSVPPLPSEIGRLRRGSGYTVDRRDQQWAIRGGLAIGGVWVACCFAAFLAGRWGAADMEAGAAPGFAAITYAMGLAQGKSS